jgi:hypothetical protein
MACRLRAAIPSLDGPWHGRGDTADFYIPDLLDALVSSGGDPGMKFNLYVRNEFLLKVLKELTGQGNTERATHWGQYLERQKMLGAVSPAELRQIADLLDKAYMDDVSVPYVHKLRFLAALLEGDNHDA